MMLVQLIYIAGNVNHAVSIIGCQKYDSNYKRAFYLIKQSMDIICSLSKDKKGMYAEFKDVYYDVMYVNAEAKLANIEQVKTSLYCGFVKEIIYISVFQY